MRAPRSLSSAVKQVVGNLDDESISALRCASADAARVAGHRTIETWMLNHWGLAEGKGPLYQWFVKHLGLHHPSDMTAVIFHCVWAHVRERNVESLVRRVRRYWECHGRRPDSSFLEVVAIMEQGSKRERLTVLDLLGNHLP